MEARRKQRSFQHVMESESYQIIQEHLPKHWVIREFNHPDYGIDLVIEIFEPVSDTSKEYEAVGEYVYVQVKSVQEVDVKREKLYSVANVAKGTWKESEEDFIEADVIKYVMDTNSLLTVEQMGASISFLLFVADLKNRQTYFICLNDLIDKHVRPKNIKYLEQANVTLTIPVLNILSDFNVAHYAIKLYGKRAKLLAAFAKFFYQRNEILNFFKIKELPVITLRDQLEQTNAPDFSVFADMISHFISQIERLDIWLIDWEAIAITKTELQRMVSMLSDDKTSKVAILDQVMLTWHSLCNLANLYEEIVREWFLPKYLSYLMSYPIPPEN